MLCLILHHPACRLQLRQWLQVCVSLRNVKPTISLVPQKLTNATKNTGDYAITNCAVRDKCRTCGKLLSYSSNSKKASPNHYNSLLNVRETGTLLVKTEVGPQRYLQGVDLQ